MKHLLEKTASLAATALVVATSAADAKITLPSLIADGMVVQQQCEARLWGTTSHKGGTVTITPSWSGQATTCKADSQGRWQAAVLTPKAGRTEYTLTIDDGEPTTLQRVTVGEVWLASGQSNMEMPLRGFDNCPVDGYQETVMLANQNTGVHIFTVEKRQDLEPQEQCRGSWQQASITTAPDMSATAYHFATALAATLDVPVGVVVCAYGGSRVESWLPRDIVQTYTDLDLSPEGMEKMVGWERPVVLYNAMFRPVRGYTYKGIIWYQGESNVGSYATYASRLSTMVSLWRQELQLGDLPFYSVEIAPYADYGGCGPLLREQQHKAAAMIANSACVSTNDLAKPYERRQIHPCTKKPVGTRLAAVALNKTYGLWSVPCEGPTYKCMSTEGHAATITFDHSAGGFSRLDDIGGFLLAGADHVFHPADTVQIVSTSTVRVSSRAVVEPVAVRYAFGDFTPGNLAGINGLPVVPFRTDDW